MDLQSLTIKNYRSIKNVSFKISTIDNGRTFCLIGVNESGKSSFLRALSLIDSDHEKVSFPKDFFNENEEINISLKYKLNPNDEKLLKKILSEQGFDNEALLKIKIREVDVTTTYDPNQAATRRVFDCIKFENKFLEDFTLKEAKPFKKEPQGNQENLDLEKYFETYLSKYFWQHAHFIIFWKPDSKHLINEEIDLIAFANNPENISIPLMNCFELAGIQTSQIEKIKTDTAEISNLQDKLSDKVTAHLKKVWPKHPVKIKFQINNMKLSLLIEDDHVKYKSKTTAQRSDGFRQFISFLLTISAENATKQLSNSLLLLDEPETHLHPQAQEYLKEELIKITKNDENNIVFFATHSNYMIDKDHIDRCYRVLKQSNKRTELEQIKLGRSSFAEVNYEVFAISSSDYHNELYGYIEEREKSKLDNLDKNRKWKNKKNGNTENVSLATYIRHTIHHPENTSNQRFTSEELEESIKILRNLRDEVI
ncbi:MAG: AAA family ATPase [Candidatus Peribacteraceae bacterium]|nr:AAA family ATPase [Candidatus Peribacteraceae bacterium]